MGIFGAGNAGAALTKFVAPSLVVAYGWEMVPKVYAVGMFVTVVLFWMFTYEKPEHKVAPMSPWRISSSCWGIRKSGSTCSTTRWCLAGLSASHCG